MVEKKETSGGRGGGKILSPGKLQHAKIWAILSIFESSPKLKRAEMYKSVPKIKNSTDCNKKNNC